MKKFSSTLRRRFSLMFLISGALIVAFSNDVISYARALRAPDGIYIPHPTHEFQRNEDKGGVYSHTFRIYNARPRRLSIQVEADCGCTSVTWKQAIIAPFGWKDLSATMEQQRQHNLHTHGAVWWKTSSQRLLLRCRWQRKEMCRRSGRRYSV